MIRKLLLALCMTAAAATGGLLVSAQKLHAAGPCANTWCDENAGYICTTQIGWSCVTGVSGGCGQKACNQQ